MAAERSRWCLEHGLRVVQPMTLMSMGFRNEPERALLPSIPLRRLGALAPVNRVGDSVRLPRQSAVPMQWFDRRISMPTC
jgi:hypothetical protein